MPICSSRTMVKWLFLTIFTTSQASHKLWQKYLSQISDFPFLMPRSWRVLRNKGKQSWTKIYSFQSVSMVKLVKLGRQALSVSSFFGYSSPEIQSPEISPDRNLIYCYLKINKTGFQNRKHFLKSKTTETSYCTTILRNQKVNFYFRQFQDN